MEAYSMDLVKVLLYLPLALIKKDKRSKQKRLSSFV